MVDIVACVGLVSILLSEVVLLLSLLRVFCFFVVVLGVVAICVACRAAWVYDTVSPQGDLFGGGRVKGEFGFWVEGGKVMHCRKASV